MAAAPPQKPKPRLTFKEKHLLETLPARIEELRARKASSSRCSTIAGLYARDPAKFAEVSEAFAKAEAELAEAEEDWLELEMLREESEG